MVRAIGEGVDKRGWVIFTDASASSYGIGWGYAAFKHGFCVSIFSGSLTECSAYMAEAYALLQAVKYVNTITGLGSREEIEIRCDAQGLVRALGKYVLTDMLLSKIKEELRKAFHDGKKIIVRWVPGHKDISGNKFVDKIAKKAVDMKNTTRMRVTIQSKKSDTHALVRY